MYEPEKFVFNMAEQLRKFYLSGEIVGSYRSQNIIKVLTDSNIPFASLPIALHIPTFSSQILRKLIGAIALILTAPVRLLFIINSTHLLVLPMNWNAIVYFELIVAKIFKRTIIVDYYISLYDTEVNDRKTISAGSISAKKLLLKDKLLLKLASKVIFLNKSESTYYQNIAKYTVKNDKIVIIPLVIDYKNEKFALPTSQARKDIRSEFNVCWWGTYIPLHGLENIIESFAYLKNKNINLYIFGNSDLSSKPYTDLIEKLGVKDIIKVNNDSSFSNGKLAPFLNENCDLALGNFGKSDKAKTVLVNKLVDALALGLPCLTIATHATKELLNEGQGIIYTSNSPSDIANKIEQLSKNQPYLEKVGKNGFEVYLNNFSPDKFKAEFIKLLR